MHQDSPEKSQLLCTAPKEKAESLTPVLIMLTEIQTRRQSKAQQANLKKISSLLLSSVQTGFTDNTQAGNEKQMFTMKKDSMSALPSSCPHAETNSNSLSDQSQWSHLSPSGQFPQLSALDTLPELCLLSCRAGVSRAVRFVRRAAVSCSVTLPRVSGDAD